jgi:hypothetical protein
MSASATGHKERGRHIMDVTWTGAVTTDVDVYRNGVLIATVPNSGAYQDRTDNRGKETYVYQVCEPGSTTSCSTAATVVF